MRHRLRGLSLGVGMLAGLADLLGPWRPEPFALDPAFVAAVGAACRREIERTSRS